jgi:hypothetical protein
MGDINTAINTPTVLAGIGSGNFVGGDVHADTAQNVGSVHANDYFPGYGVGDINTAVNTPTVLAGVGSGNVIGGCEGGSVHADTAQNVGSFHYGDEGYCAPSYGSGDINTAVNTPTVLAGIGDHNFVGGDVHADTLQNVGSFHL